MSALKERVARFVHGPRWDATLRLCYDDWHGRDEFIVHVLEFRARTRDLAARFAVVAAQREAMSGWKTLHVDDLRAAIAKATTP